EFFKSNFKNSGNRVTFIDLGCGPMTSGLAINQHFSTVSKFCFNYIGIDISNAMLKKAREFYEAGLFNKESKVRFENSMDDISKDYWDSMFMLSTTVIINASYLFGNLHKATTEKLALQINNLIDNYETNKYIFVYQNSAF
ncbi:MAG TPA: class I SAM-dependent methyltransferase, partial [Aquella sp.]|nr:class I SAM-dependent methyltransferase [Aquella sp.]